MKRFFTACAPLMLTALLSATPALAQSPALDQANEPYSLYSVQLYTGAVPGGQTFTAGKNGYLTRASVYVQKQCLPNCPDMLVQLRSTSGAVLASGTVSQSVIPTGSYNWIDVDFSAPVLVAAGTQYALVVQNAQPYYSGGYDWRYEANSSVDSYPGGMLFQVGYNSHPAYDLYFRTYVVAAEVLDQANEPYSLYSAQLYTGAVPGGQTFTAGQNGYMKRASVYVQKQCLPDCPDMLVQLRSTSGAVLASGTVSQAQIPSGSYNWIDVTFSAPVAVAAGTQYALVVQNVQPYFSGGYDWRFELDSAVDSYAGGMLFQVGYNSHPAYDLYFRTYVSSFP
ncbi:MAG TPA: DUF4082 domain-containing protein [Archangium sp.]|uniref:DUF4082 domain-containing protein n=1 Tax=Archangium sp. TaxID=1872627 RepID=UPI002E33ECB8|nr:DUF4082 domain-containing protein [Archangium sp.]HEX5746650.1 DUF4082 domain-containing protein [Archangium sp.]